jgi:Passenger-associated-transport-repeat
MLFKQVLKMWRIGICHIPGLLGFLAAAILVLSTSIADSASYSWQVSSGDWSTPSCWGGTEPTATDDAYITSHGTAIITQAGEKCNDLYAGDYSSSAGVHMLGGTLSVFSSAYVGGSYMGTFTQSGGINTVSKTLFVSSSSSPNAETYILSGTGQLSANEEEIEQDGTFTQTGGTNAAYIRIDAGGIFNLSGGTLNLSNGGLDNQGTFNLFNGTAVINTSSSIINLRGATYAAASNKTLNILDAHSLLILPSGHNPTDYFANFSNAGSLVHQAGSTLDIPAGYSVSGAVSTIEDHVTCHGSLSAAAGRYINLIGGLNVYDGGSANLRTGNLTVDDATSGISGGSLNANTQYVGYSGTGIFTQTAGTNILSWCLFLGYNSSSSGTYILSGTGQLSAVSECVDAGTFTHTGGTNTLGEALTVDSISATSATYNLSGTGQLAAKYEHIGSNGTGTFTQTGGANTVSSTLYIGESSGSSGTYSQTGGTNTITNGGSNGVYLGYNSGSSGTYILSGGTLSTPNIFVDLSGSGRFGWFCNGLTPTRIFLGSNGILAMGFDFDMATLTSGTFKGTTISGLSSATLEITNGATATQSANIATSIVNLRIGTSSGNGTYNLSGIGQLPATNEHVGYSGMGTFTQTGATNTVSSSLYLGTSSGASGTYNLSDTGQISTAIEYVGYSGTGTFSQTGGTNTVSSYLYLGYNAGSSGNYILSGTGQLSAKNEYISMFGTGTFTQTGGTHTATINLTWGYSSSGTYNLNGGTLILKGLSKGNGTAAFNFGGGTLRANGIIMNSTPMTLTGIGGDANIDSAGTSFTWSGVLSGIGGLTKLGSGKMTLSALNTYSGNTTVKGGTLDIAGGIGAGGTSLIDIQSGAATFKTTPINKSSLNINTAALTTFEVVNCAHTVGAISGGGITQVDAGASLTAASINQGTLTIGSGATVTIQAIPGGPQSGPITSVPEPNTCILLGTAFIMLCYAWTKKVK